MLVFGHELGIVAGVGVFAACASGYDGAAPEPGERERLGAQSSTPLIHVWRAGSGYWIPNLTS